MIGICPNAATDTLPTGFFVVDAANQILIWNRWMIEQTGLERLDAIGRNIAGLFPNSGLLESALSQFRNHAGSSSCPQNPHGYLIPIRLAPASSAGHLHMRQECHLARLDGQTNAVAVTIRNVTTQIANRERIMALQNEAATARDAALANESLYRALVDNLKEGVFQTDAAGNYTFLNPAWFEITGHAVSPSRGRQFLDFIHPDDRAQAAGLFQMLSSRAREFFRVELRLLHHNGRPRWAQIFARPLLNKNGEFTGMSGTLSDETERRQIELSLRESERRFRETIENVRLVSVCLDLDGNIIFCNEFLTTLTGWDREEALGQNWFELFVPQDRIDLRESFLNSMQNGDVPTHLEHEIVTRSGGRRVIAWNNTPWRDLSGRVVGTASLGEDITDRKLAEEQLRLAKEAAEDANRAKSEFLATMSHEIRTPMNGVLGFTSLLLDTPLAQEQREYVETIRTSGETLLHLINEILDFSKIEAKKLVLEHVTFDLGACLNDCLKLILPRATEKNLKLELLLDSRIPQAVVADITRVRQVVLNLLSNAVKFTGKGGVFVEAKLLSIGESDLNLEIRVSDSGIGIPGDKLQKLFKAFTQVDASTTRKFGGTGLGLAISKRIAEAMNGGISVESVEGSGTTFIFRFTAQIATELPQGIPSPSTNILISEPASHPLPASSHVRLLLAEDNVVNQRLTSAMLKKLGYRADVVADGAEVLDLLSRRQYDVILMDVQMPEIDGLEATRQIRSRWPRDQQPYIIAVTANAMKGDDQMCLDAGMDTYLSKPIVLSKLDAALRAAVESISSNPLMAIRLAA